MKQKSLPRPGIDVSNSWKSYRIINYLLYLYDLITTSSLYEKVYITEGWRLD